MSLMFHSTVLTFGSSEPEMGLGTSYVLSARICSTAGSSARLFKTPWPAVTLIVLMIQNGWYCAPAFFRKPRNPAWLSSAVCLSLSTTSVPRSFQLPIFETLLRSAFSLRITQNVALPLALTWSMTFCSTLLFGPAAGAGAV